MEIESEVFGDDNALESELVGLSNDDIRQRIRAFDNEVRIMKSDMNRIKHEAKEQMAHVKDNKEKVKMNKVVGASTLTSAHLRISVTPNYLLLFVVCFVLPTNSTLNHLFNSFVYVCP